MVIDDTGSVEDTHAFIYCKKWTGVTDASLTTLKDRATQLLKKYKSGALVTQFMVEMMVTKPVLDHGSGVLGGRSHFVPFLVQMTTISRESEW